MTKQDAGKDYLVCLFGDNNLDVNSNFELDAIIHGGYSEVDSAFGGLSIASRDHQDITASPSFETATNRTKRRMGHWGTQDFPEPSPCDQRRKITLSPPWSIAMLQGAPTNPVATQLLPTHHREGGSDELGMAATSRSTQPLQSNNLKEVCRASAEPTVPSDNASSTAEGPTAASGVAVMGGGREIVFLSAN